MTDGITSDRCPLCGGAKEAGTTAFTAEPGFGVVVIRDVPAAVCTQCGADWLADATAAPVESIVENARRKHSQVEVTVYA
jgi:YgiT-type zinc finger domain-containing protein